MTKKHIFLVFLILATLILWIIFLKTKHKDNQDQQNTSALNYTCSEFILNDKPVECTVEEILSFNESKEYLRLIDDIEKNGDDYFLLVYAKDKNNLWVTQKLYIGKKEDVLVIKTQQDNFFRLALVKTLNRETVKVNDLPDYINTHKLKGKEVAILVSKGSSYNQEYEKVSLIRYITNQ